MRSKIEDAVWAPHEETVEIKNFLADNERLLNRRTHNTTALVYSTEQQLHRAGVPDPQQQSAGRLPRCGRGGPPCDSLLPGRECRWAWGCIRLTW